MYFICKREHNKINSLVHTEYFLSFVVRRVAVEKFQHSPLVMNCILGQQAYTYLIPKVMNISMTNQNHGLGYSFP